MGTTLDTLKAMQTQQAHNDAYTDAELDAARAEGAQAVSDAMARGDTIFLMDEASTNDLFSAYAVGWNSGWAKACSKGAPDGRG